MSAPLKIALWQTTGHCADVAANLAALEATSRAAALAGATLLLCPECWLGGYHIGEAVQRVAEACDGPAFQRIASLAQAHRLAIVYGYAEREAHTGWLYNSVQAVGPDGLSLGHYRKTHLSGPAERSVYRPGDAFGEPFELGGMRLGLLICYDVEYPEAVRSVALSGAELILVPTALTSEYAVVPELIVAARAIESQIYIAYCNKAGVENGLQFLGGSRVAGPDGRALAAAGAGETLLVSELDPQVRAQAAQLFPYRTDRRPELYGRVSAT